MAQGQRQWGTTTPTTAQNMTKLPAEEERSVPRQDIQNKARVAWYLPPFISMVPPPPPPPGPSQNFQPGRAPATNTQTPVAIVGDTRRTPSQASAWSLRDPRDRAPLRGYSSLRTKARPCSHGHPLPHPPISVPNPGRSLVPSSPAQVSLTYQISAPHDSGEVSSLR